MRSHSRLGLGTALATATLGLLLAVGPDPRGLADAVDDPQRWVRAVGPDSAVLAVSAAMCWLVLGWLCVGLLLVAGAELPGLAGRIAAALGSVALPATLRRSAALALGVGIVTAGAGSASAATLAPPSAALSWAPATPSWTAGVPSWTPAEPSWTLAGHGWESPDPAGSVDWPVAPASPPPASPPPTAPPPTVPPPTAPPPGAQSPSAPPYDGAVLVVSGDTLWAIAADSLTPGACNREIAAAVGDWFLANRAVIGPDPDLILPGQRLAPPPDAGHS